MASSISGANLLCFAHFCNDKVVTLPLNVYLAILGAFIGVLIGIVSLRISKEVCLPNTLLLIVIGIILGLTLYKNSFWFETFIPQTIPFVLIPPILFESSSGVDIHVFSRLF